MISYLPKYESDRRWVCAFGDIVHVLWVRPPSARSVARSLHCDNLFFLCLCFRLLRRIGGEGGKGGRGCHHETRSITGNFYCFPSHSFYYTLSVKIFFVVVINVGECIINPENIGGYRRKQKKLAARVCGTHPVWAGVWFREHKVEVITSEAPRLGYFRRYFLVYIPMTSHMP